MGSGNSWGCMARKWELESRVSCLKEMVKDTGVIMTRSVMSLVSGGQQDPEGEKEVTGGHGQHVQILTLRTVAGRVLGTLTMSQKLKSPGGRQGDLSGCL